MNSILERVKGIMINPKKEWEVISQEEETMSKVFTTYVLPLLALATIAAFIGYGFIWRKSLFLIGTIRGGLFYAITYFISVTIGVFLSAFVIDLLAPSFNSQKNINKSFQLVAYSYTPALIGGLLMIFPPISILGTLFGLYGLYILYEGLKPMMKTPKEKALTYLIISILVLIAIYFVVSFIITFIIGGILR